MMMLILLLSAAQPASGNSEFLPLLHAYKGCVQANWAIFAEANEPVADTVAASFAACKNERASIILMMNSKKKSDGSDLWSLDRAEKFVADLIDKPLEDELTVELFSERAREK